MVRQENKIAMNLNFCKKCGSRTIKAIPPGDNRERTFCTSCQHIEYKNPRNVVGCLAYKGDQVLMCRRAIEPGYGLWTLPAGYMEIGESLIDCAKRETFEEVGVDVEIGPLFAVVDLVHIEEVHFYFLAAITSDTLMAGDETLETKLVGLHNIPWADIAFSSVKFALKKFTTGEIEGLHHAVATKPRPHATEIAASPRPTNRRIKSYFFYE